MLHTNQIQFIDNILICGNILISRNIYLKKYYITNDNDNSNKIILFRHNNKNNTSLSYHLLVCPEHLTIACNLPLSQDHQKKLGDKSNLEFRLCIQTVQSNNVYTVIFYV